MNEIPTSDPEVRELLRKNIDVLFAESDFVIHALFQRIREAEKQE